MDKAFLSVKELSVRLGVSEKTVYRMLGDGMIPFAIKIGGQWRFNSEKIDKWIVASRSSEPGKMPINSQIRVVDALVNGLISYRVHGSDRDELLDDVLGMLDALSPEQGLGIKKNILYRESIISSSLQGVSFLTPELDGSYEIDTTKLIFAYLEEPMNFKAIDGVDTYLVILLLAANKTERLIVKTRLQRLLMEADFFTLLQKQLNRRQLTDDISALESRYLG